MRARRRETASYRGWETPSRAGKSVRSRSGGCRGASLGCGEPEDRWWRGRKEEEEEEGRMVLPPVRVSKSSSLPTSRPLLDRSLSLTHEYWLGSHRGSSTAEPKVNHSCMVQIKTHVYSSSSRDFSRQPGIVQQCFLIQLPKNLCKRTAKEVKHPHVPDSQHWK